MQKQNTVKSNEKQQKKKKIKINKSFKDKYFQFYDDIKTTPKQDW